jgi:hypothetical protein
MSAMLSRLLKPANIWPLRRHDARVTYGESMCSTPACVHIASMTAVRSGLVEPDPAGLANRSTPVGTSAPCANGAPMPGIRTSESAVSRSRRELPCGGVTVTGRPDRASMVTVMSPPTLSFGSTRTVV